MDVRSLVYDQSSNYSNWILLLIFINSYLYIAIKDYSKWRESREKYFLQTRSIGRKFKNISKNNNDKDSNNNSYIYYIPIIVPFAIIYLLIKIFYDLFKLFVFHSLDFIEYLVIVIINNNKILLRFAGNLIKSSLYYTKIGIQNLIYYTGYICNNYLSVILEKFIKLNLMIFERLSKFVRRANDIFTKFIADNKEYFMNTLDFSIKFVKYFIEKASYLLEVFIICVKLVIRDIIIKDFKYIINDLIVSFLVRNKLAIVNYLYYNLYMDLTNYFINIYIYNFLSDKYLRSSIRNIISLEQLIVSKFLIPRFLALKILISQNISLIIEQSIIISHKLFDTLKKNLSVLISFFNKLVMENFVRKINLGYMSKELSEFCMITFIGAVVFVIDINYIYYYNVISHYYNIIYYYYYNYFILIIINYYHKRLAKIFIAIFHLIKILFNKSIDLSISIFNFTKQFSILIGFTADKLVSYANFIFINNKFAQLLLNGFWRALINSYSILSNFYYNHLKSAILDIYLFINSKILSNLYLMLDNFIYDVLAKQYLVIRDILIEKLPLIINELKTMIDNFVVFIGQKSIEIVKNEVNQDTATDRGELFSKG